MSLIRKQVVPIVLMEQLPLALSVVIQALKVLTTNPFLQSRSSGNRLVGKKLAEPLESES